MALISLTNLHVSNQMARNVSHGNPMDIAEGSPNASKTEILAGEDVWLYTLCGRYMGPGLLMQNLWLV
jgi:hypothetical protein